MRDWPVCLVQCLVVLMLVNNVLSVATEQWALINCQPSHLPASTTGMSQSHWELRERKYFNVRRRRWAATVMGCISSKPSGGKSQTITPGHPGGAGGTIRPGDCTAWPVTASLIKVLIFAVTGGETGPDSGQPFPVPSRAMRWEELEQALQESTSRGLYQSVLSPLTEN